MLIYFIWPYCILIARWNIKKLLKSSLLYFSNPQPILISFKLLNFWEVLYFLNKSMHTCKANKGDDRTFMWDTGAKEQDIKINSPLSARVWKKGWAEECSLLQFELRCWKGGEETHVDWLHMGSQKHHRDGKREEGWIEAPPARGTHVPCTGSGCGLAIPLQLLIYISILIFRKWCSLDFPASPKILQQNISKRKLSSMFLANVFFIT